MSSTVVMKAEGVRKSFGRTEVLKGIDLQVNQGGVLCIIGPSGSGKSTFLRCINHLEKIDGGRLTVNNALVGYREHKNKLFELPDREICRQRAEIGMVFQHFNLFPHKTVVENIIEGPIQVRKAPRKEATEKAYELLGKVGLKHRGDAYPREMSGGQQQRVAIARAMAMEPKLMLFDEATSALDPELVGEVLDVMGKLAASGMTMVMVTHEIGFARQVGDNVAFIDHGIVVEQGPPVEVLGNPQHTRTQAFLSKVL